MGIYIRGMEMPKTCGDCVLCRPKGPYPCYCYLKQFPIKPSETDLRDGLCPLVKLPPHGRLIDADELELDEAWSEYEDGFTAFSQSAINHAPTIIEAEE